MIMLNCSERVCGIVERVVGIRNKWEGGGKGWSVVVTGGQQAWT